MPSLSCDMVDQDANLAIYWITRDTEIGPLDLRAKLRRTNLEIRSIDHWESEGQDVAGITSGYNIAVERHGWPLAHELIHEWTFQHLLETDLINYIALEHQDHDHVGWSVKGYYQAEKDYRSFYTALVNWPILGEE